MSVVAQNLKRPWLAIGAGGLVVAVIAAIVIANLPGRHVISQGHKTEGSLAAPAFEQPAWKIDAYPAGTSGKITKAQREAVAKQRVKVEALVTPVYDALFLEPKDVDAALKAAFTKGAAAELARARVGFSKDASDVRILRRSARLGISAAGARLAAAKIKVVATADVDGKEIEIKHSSILWLQRGERGWQVIGFEVDQGPKAAADGHKKETRPTKGNDRPKGKKRS